MNSKFLACALSIAILFFVSMSVYALHARSSAIRGWAEVNRLTQIQKDAEAKAAKAAKAARTSAARTSELLKFFVLKSAGLPITAPVNQHQANLAVRDYVYRSNSIGEASQTFPSNGHRYALLGEAGFEQLCGGMAIAFQWALTQIGIPARTVQLAGRDFLAGKNRYDTHVLVEVWLDDKWQISDPTFNTSVKCSSGTDRLSVPEARDCVKRGGKIVAVPGKTQISGRTIDDYDKSYDNFFAAYSRAQVDTPDISAKADEYPEPDWLQKSIQLY